MGMCFLHIVGYHLISSQRLYCLVTPYWDIIITIRHKLSCNRGKVRHKTDDMISMGWDAAFSFHISHIPWKNPTSPVRYQYHGSTAGLVLIYISTRNMHAMLISNIMHVYLHAVSVFAWMMSLLSHLLSHLR